MSVDNLLIIGNGFDLKSELKSSYNDFFYSEEMKRKQEKIEKFYEQLELILEISHSKFHTSDRFDLILTEKNYGELKMMLKHFFDNESFCFWNLVFMDLNTKDPNWNQIEKIIEDIVCGTAIGNDNRTTTEHYYKRLIRNRGLKNNSNFRSIGVEKYRLVYAIYAVTFNINEIDLFSFLLNELKVFEQQFHLYLDKEMKSNTSYKTNVKFLLEDIRNSYTSEDQSNVVNFNYTTIKGEPNINMESNVHGSLAKGNIIFGIDLTNINDDKGSFYFTKTYRKMHAFENVKISDFKNQSILDDNIDRISFYGHSLNESDYSYFQSIFDYYEIYNSHVSLIFYYSIYDSNKSVQIKESYTNAIINLLNTYGKTMANEFHGKNFLHKLMLENRVILKKI